MEFPINSGKKITVLITGPAGYIGSALLKRLNHNNESIKLKLISRLENDSFDCLNFADFVNGKYDKDFFMNIDVCVHLAGLAHNFGKIDEEENTRVNFTYLENLLMALKESSLKKFIFCSSMAVSLLENNIFHDTFRYSVLKRESEELLKRFYRDNTLVDVVILRPPLVYGQNAPGNFSQLVKILSLNLPLPFGSLRNIRPYIHIKNLVEILVTVIFKRLPERISCVEVKDPFDVTMADFLKDLQKNLVGRSLIFKFPPFLLSFIFFIIGKKNIYRKLAFNFSIKCNPFDSIPLEKYPVGDSSLMFKDLK